MSENQDINKKLIGQCLVAFDLDKTVLDLSRDAGVNFITRYFNPIHELAQLGFNISLVTSNRIEEVINRFFVPMIHILCEFQNVNLRLLKQFHFFANGAGIHIEFKNTDFCAMENNLNRLNIPDRIKEINKYFFLEESNKLQFKPEFIDTNYIKLTEIGESDVKSMSTILESVKNKWWDIFINNYNAELYNDYWIYDYRLQKEKFEDVENEAKKYNSSLYKLTDDEGNLLLPFIEKREIVYQNKLKACTQITIKPLLSYKHYKGEGFPGNDPRKLMISEIQESINKNTNLLKRYCVKEGGRTSIDISVEVVNKRFSIEYLIRQEGLQGLGRGKEVGSETIFLGDEIVLGGNDISVAEIPGIFVFAVNSDKKEIPLKSNIIVNPLLHGPQATAEWLTVLTISAKELIIKCQRNNQVLLEYLTERKTVLDDFKYTIVKKRVEEHIKYLTNINEILALNVILTLLSRPPESEQFANLLMTHIDAIFKILEEIKHNPKLAFEIAKGLGVSR